MVRTAIAQCLIDWRREAAVAREVVAAATSRSLSTVQRWETGAARPRVEDLIVLERMHPGLLVAIAKLAADTPPVPA